MNDLSAILDAIALRPADSAAWQAFAQWLADNGRDDEAAVVRVYWRVLADTLAVRSMAEVLKQLAENAQRLGKMARDSEEQSYRP